ncbi:uncharacterized protein LOC116257365 isoform X2 [Nymphaea colorata]|uniref:uncharacterized protein LOC116257365 isoform X2 n=1 Tax=Nymphaea colorata TaxID=210225 RepID=UPI00129D5A50|nr:uncharacterized protein LOC116257365 isoform X2 [Nymphaea colorata]
MDRFRCSWASCWPWASTPSSLLSPVASSPPFCSPHLLSSWRALRPSSTALPLLFTMARTKQTAHKSTRGGRPPGSNWPPRPPENRAALATGGAKKPHRFRPKTVALWGWKWRRSRTSHTLLLHGRATLKISSGRKRSGKKEEVGEGRERRSTRLPWSPFGNGGKPMGSFAGWRADEEEGEMIVWASGQPGKTRPSPPVNKNGPGWASGMVDQARYAARYGARYAARYPARCPGLDPIMQPRLGSSPNRKSACLTFSSSFPPFVSFLLELHL